VSLIPPEDRRGVKRTRRRKRTKGEGRAAEIEIVDNLGRIEGCSPPF